MEGIDARLWLLGPWETKAYQDECEQLKTYSKCDYYGSLPFGEHYAYLYEADIGLINFYPEKNHLDSLPNKIFEYMACGLPMVVSDFEYWRKSFGKNALFANP
jgi:glycosyltransferase involved in cell wall biosynthesis